MVATSNSDFQNNQSSTLTGGQRIVFADGLRGFAALWVVMFHMSEGHHLPTLTNLIPAWLTTVLFDSGHLGVPVFFVLSGFVMAYTVRKTQINVVNAGIFLTRRMIRLTPPYYVAIAIAILMGYVKAKALGLKFEIILESLFAHGAYLHLALSSTPINSVFWTLAIEVQFYLAFAILMLMADRLASRLFVFSRLIIFGLSAAIALFWPTHITEFTPWHGCFLGFWYSFLAGCLVCWGWLENGKMQFFAISYGLSLLFIGYIHAEPFTITVAVTSIFLILAGMIGAMSKWLSWAWIQYLALISYSLYLIHNPLTGATFNIVKRLLKDGIYPELLGLATSLTVCILSSWVMYQIIEKPSINWSHLLKFRRDV